MWTHGILEKIWIGENIKEDWRTSILALVYKGKGDVLECGNHRGTKLLEHLLKVEEKILDQKIREVVDIGNMQFGFRPGRATTDAVFILRQLQEKHLEGNKSLYHAFVGLEKAYDRVPIELVYWCLRKKGVLE
ncbi:uncharacterized protein LOC125034470 [Penaeus chinensis]|uniref:uncharacterized protein LOC125034470 n=1 Tax=Penaeus chinensis TaxID=139456 RepID=UPI001FB61C57|nr:uncharacterized protein LOC125034470 [Penaeus chinensis]